MWYHGHERTKAQQVMPSLMRSPWQPESVLIRKWPSTTLAGPRAKIWIAASGLRTSGRPLEEMLVLILPPWEIA